MVSNRLPLSLEESDDGEWRAIPAAGGLIAALDPVMRRRGGVWVGWPGVADTELATLSKVIDEQCNRDSPYRLEPVSLSTEDVEGFYEGFSNEVIWPLFHNRFTACNFDPNYWASYQSVNRLFAQRIVDVAQPDDFIWVHDYHMVNVADELRALGVENRIAFFQHIPFPPADIFCNLPWWREILRALMSYDFIGFQTVTDRLSFIEVVRTLFDDIEVHDHEDERSDIEIKDSDLAETRRCLRIGSLPISIDYDHINEVAAKPETQAHVADFRENWHGVKVVLGVDRLDYTKGLPEKLEAFREALRRHPELQGRISLQQHVIPSRQQVPEYAEQKEEIERLVGEVNGEFTTSGWVPIHYIFRRIPPEELMAHYQVADIALVTPLKDGMNLVAKEYCAAHRDEDGVMILSEFAGTAAEFGDQALLINPHDVINTADAIHRAYEMAPDERQRRMRAMREIVANHTAYDWVESFLNAAGADA